MGDRPNRLEVVPRNVPPRLELDEQERCEHRRERTQPDADPVLDGASYSGIYGFENDRVEAGRSRTKKDGCTAERAADNPDPTGRRRRALEPLERGSNISGFTHPQGDRSTGRLAMTLKIDQQDGESVVQQQLRPRQHGRAVRAYGVKKKDYRRVAAVIHPPAGDGMP